MYKILKNIFVLIAFALGIYLIFNDNPFWINVDKFLALIAFTFLMSKLSK